MSYYDVATKIQFLVTRQLGVQEAKVIESASLVEDLGADDYDLMELATTVAEAFAMTIPTTIMQEIVTVKDLIDYVITNVPK